MDENSRHLHLRGALGAVRTGKIDDQEYLIVPVVALMDGVIHAVNASTPERVTAETLSKAASSWNGRPLVLGHPTKNGRQCSANEPDIKASHQFGLIFNSRMQGPKLLMDAYVDPARAEKIGGPDFVKKLRNGEQIEVSVGAYVQTRPEEGIHNGKPYKAMWLETHGDHLAFLPGGRGACSIEMGCGAHRAAEMHLVTAEEIKILATKDCPVCSGTGQVKNEQQKQEDCPSCEGSGRITTAETNDGSAVTEVNMKKVDAIKALTACPCSGFLPADAKELEAFSEERLTAMAEAAAARKVETDKTAADLKDEKEKNIKAAADLKAAETTITELKAAASKQPTEEEYLANAPESIRTLVAEKKAADAKQKDELVTKLKAASNGAYTEDELKALSIAELVKIAKVAKVDVADFSGRAIPIRTAESASQYTPPDPYEAGIKALQGSKAVN